MTWSMSQFEMYLPREAWDEIVTYWMTSGMMIGILLIAGSYSPVHFLLQSKSKVYRALSRDQQVVVVTHVIEAVLLSLLFVPFSYLILSINFEEQDSDAFQRKATTVGTFMFVIIIMYMVELAARFSSPRPLVAIHHVCAFADALFAALVTTTANMRAASLLVYFITFEAVTFMGLVLYRLWPHHRWTRPVIGVGMLIFGLSRPLQLVSIYGSLIVTWDDTSATASARTERWQSYVQMGLTLLFTVLQVYSLTIHYGMYIRCCCCDDKNQVLEACSNNGNISAVGVEIEEKPGASRMFEQGDEDVYVDDTNYSSDSTTERPALKEKDYCFRNEIDV